CSFTPRVSHSFPTRRSSDLSGVGSGNLFCLLDEFCDEPATAKEALGMQMQMRLSCRKVSPKTRKGNLHTMAEVRALSQFFFGIRSEEHTSELQSRFDLVCRL